MNVLHQLPDVISLESDKMSLTDDFLQEMGNSDWDTFEVTLKEVLSGLYRETISRATNGHPEEIENLSYDFFEALFESLPQRTVVDKEVQHKIIVACVEYASSLVKED